MTHGIVWALMMWHAGHGFTVQALYTNESSCTRFETIANAHIDNSAICVRRDVQL